MSALRRKDLINKITKNKLNNSTVMNLNILTDLDSIVTRSFDGWENVSIGPGSDFDMRYNIHEAPTDVFQCLPSGCTNSGRLELSALPTGTPANYRTVGTKISTDATQFVTGIVTFYVWLPESTSVHVLLSLGSIHGGANPGDVGASGWDQVITSVSEGWYPVIFDLAEFPNAWSLGHNWIPDTAGVSINIGIAPAGLLTGVNTMDTSKVGLSTLRIFRDLSDFQVNEVVQLGCLTDISGDISIDTTESTCLGAAYDDSNLGFEITVTAELVTENVDRLNMLSAISDNTEGWYIEQNTLTVQETERDGIRFGFIQVADISPDECGFLLLQRADNCNVLDARINRVQVPTAQVINQTQFIVLKEIEGDLTTRGFILVHESLIGQDVNISYPKWAIVEEYVWDGSKIHSTRVRMTYPVVLNDNTIETRLFENVLVTSFPNTIGRDTTTFPFTFVIQRDLSGAFAKVRRHKSE